MRIFYIFVLDGNVVYHTATCPMTQHQDRKQKLCVRINNRTRRPTKPTQYQYQFNRRLSVSKLFHFSTGTYRCVTKTNKQTQVLRQYNIHRRVCRIYGRFFKTKTYTNMYTLSFSHGSCVSDERW